nr:hypothetical protein CFP56_02423 [Quercus suber]
MYARKGMWDISAVLKRLQCMAFYKGMLPPLPLPWITATASISLCLSIVAQSSPSCSMSANYFELWWRLAIMVKSEPKACG